MAGPGATDPLSARAVVAGMCVGVVVSAMNVSFGLKAGWAQGGSVISAVVSIGLFSAIAPARPFTELEANICQTTASAAGSMTMAAGLIGPIPALQMIGIQHSVWVMAAWGAAVAYLGVFFAAPLRSHFVVHNADALKFPSGTATAETIKSMFADAGKATSQIRTLVRAGVAASTVVVAGWAFPPLLKPPVLVALGLGRASRLGFGIRLDPILFGGGALMGARTGVSVLFGAVCAYGVLAPSLIESGDIENGDDPLDMKRGARGTMLWPGVAAMATDAFAQLIAARFEARHASTARGSTRDERGKPDGLLDGPKARPSLTRVFDDDDDAMSAPLFAEESELSAVGKKVRVARADAAPVSVAGAAPSPSRVAGVARLDFERERHAREARVAALLGDGRREKAEDADDLARTLRARSDGIESAIPETWWTVGLATSALLCAATLSGPFGMAAWQPALALPVAGALSYVAVRCAGETDINPIGPMGKIVQLIFAAAAPGETVANLMAAAVACGAAGQAGDLMQDFKAGRLMGLSPRKQILAQMWGIPAGLLGAVPTFALLRSAHPIGGEQFPAPAAAAWMAVAQALAGGGEANRGLPPAARRLMAGAAWLAVAVRVIEVTARAYLRRTSASNKHRRVRAFRALASAASTCFPSPTSCGIGCIIPPEYSLAVAAGAAASGYWARLDPRSHDTHAHIAASGLLAGAGVTGVLTAVAGLAAGKPGAGE